MSDSLFDVTAHQLRRQTQYPIPEPTEVTITPRIRRALLFVRAIIHFNDEPSTGSRRSQRCTCHPRLPTKRNTKLLARNTTPKDSFCFGEIVPKEVSALTDDAEEWLTNQQRLKLELLTGLLLHEDLQCPANQPGYATHSQAA